VCVYVSGTTKGWTADPAPPSPFEPW